LYGKRLSGKVIVQETFVKHRGLVIDASHSNFSTTANMERRSFCNCGTITQVLRVTYLLIISRIMILKEHVLRSQG